MQQNLDPWQPRIPSVHPGSTTSVSASTALSLCGFTALKSSTTCRCLPSSTEYLLRARRSVDVDSIFGPALLTAANMTFHDGPMWPVVEQSREHSWFRHFLLCGFGLFPEKSVSKRTKKNHKRKWVQSIQNLVLRGKVKEEHFVLAGSIFLLTFSVLADSSDASGISSY